MLSVLIWVVVLASVVALVISLTSSMRMNIGGPDSNATAFLVGVAAGVASSVRAKGGSPTVILLTVLVSIALCSVVTGVILYAIGSSKRSRSLQFLPSPVIGGFLAGTGYLLLTGAYRVMTGQVLDWHAARVFAHLHWLAWVPAVLVGSLLSSRAPDRYIRPVITFVIFASGLKYAGLGTTALGWTLCLVLLACGGYWLARNKPWRGSGADDEKPAPTAAETGQAGQAPQTEPERQTEPVKT